MKARNNKTGEIVTNFAISKEFGTISYFDSNKTLRLTTACDNEWTIIDEESTFDWQSFRAEAAKDILCAIIASPAINKFKDEKGKLIDFCKEKACEISIQYAEELVKQLKEKEEK